MKLLIWASLLGLAVGVFLDGDTNDGFLDELSEHFGGAAKAPSSQAAGTHSATGAAAATTGTGFLNEMETSLEYAADKLDGLWQQFRKGLLNLVDSSSDSDDGSHDGQGDNSRPTVTATAAAGNLLQPKPISTGLLGTATATTTTEASSTTAVLPATTTTTIAVETTTAATSL
ncbi:hypothetical protein KR222_002295 [Zaprionus bogoriensis]|nr:hypothetical protein KR222_002295 [Zaprionus bogoriensis]